jgi:hypothetical protein
VRGRSLWPRESFISDLAHRAGIDPYQYRRALLAHDPTATRVLDAAAEAAHWQASVAPNIARGIAYNCYIGRGGGFRTHVAEVAELERTTDGFVIKRITCAVDAGMIIDPNPVSHTMPFPAALFARWGRRLEPGRNGASTSGGGGSSRIRTRVSAATTCSPGRSSTCRRQ